MLHRRGWLATQEGGGCFTVGILEVDRMDDGRLSLSVFDAKVIRFQRTLAMYTLSVAKVAVKWYTLAANAEV